MEFDITSALASGKKVVGAIKQFAQFNLLPHNKKSAKNPTF
jgi:hypothetical protein